MANVFLFSCGVGGNVTLDSDGCQVRRRFFNQKNIPIILTRGILLGFTINCTTQTLYKVGYSSGVSCPCGEYLINQNGPHTNVLISCPTLNLQQVNVTVEISVENVRNPGGERCTFSFNSLGGSTKFDVRILPQNVPTSAQPSPTSEVLPSSTTHKSPTGKLYGQLTFHCKIQNSIAKFVNSLRRSNFISKFASRFVKDYELP